MVSLITMFSTIFNTPGVTALISILTLLAMRMIVGLHPLIDILNPASMSKYAMELLISGNVYTKVVGTLLASFIWTR